MQVPWPEQPLGQDTVDGKEHDIVDKEEHDIAS
jgi:hypothetical protein